MRSMMSPWQVRMATPADAETIARFNIAMARETEHKHLIPEVVARGVARLMAEPALGFYFVAESGGRIVGSGMVTTEWSDWRCGRFLWLQSVYVLPEYRRQGVFRALYGFVKAWAERQPDVCGFRLYVERDNANAQATYRSLGMSETDYRLMEEMRPGVVYLRDDAA